MPKIEFGVRVPNSGPIGSPENVRKAAVEAESLGLDSVWVHDHTMWTFEMHAHHISSGSAQAISESQEPNFYEPLTTLSYLAALTKKVKLGVAAIVLPIKNPIYAAKQCANLDVFSGGRLELVIGIGSPATMKSRDYEVMGVDITKRGEMVDEYVEVMKTIWSQPHASFSGKYISFKDAVVYPKPVQKPHPPLYIGGGTNAAIERTARLGDGWLAGWFTADELAESLVRLRERAEHYGRGSKRFVIGQEIITCLAKSDREALRLSEPTIKAGLRTYERELDVEGYLKRSLIGGPDSMRKQVEAFVMAGVTEFELRPIYSSIGELLAMMRAWSKEILPSY